MYDGTAYSGAHFISNVCRNWKSAQRKMYVLLYYPFSHKYWDGSWTKTPDNSPALNAVNSYFVQMSSAKGEHMTQNSYKICKGWTFQV